MALKTFPLTFIIKISGHENFEKYEIPPVRLLLNPDNTFEVSIDHTLVNHGTLLDSFEPPVNPPAEIDDPNDKMPAGEYR